MVRLSAFAGSFYPRDPEVLRTTVANMLAQSHPLSIPGKLRALVVPHAGYVYSGPVAASAFILAKQFGRVLLLGPSHRVGFPGLALSGATSFQSPLGAVEIDEVLKNFVAGMPDVKEWEAAHAQEHSLEVQLPFLQSVLPGVPILPVVVGHCESALVARLILECCRAFEDLLVLVSTDLSHYLNYEDCRKADAVTVAQIEALRPNIQPEQACGSCALQGLIRAALQAGWKIKSLDVRNSGDTAGGREQVVGYGAFAVWEGEQYG